MEFKRIDENTLSIYISESDMRDSELNIQELFSSDQESTQEVIYNLLREADPDGDFIDNGQLSIQIMPRGKGLVINIHKFDDNKNSEEVMKDFMSQMAGNMAKVASLEQEADKEDDETPKNYVIIGSTDNLDDVVQLAQVKPNWQADDMALYLKNNRYYLIMQYIVPDDDATMKRESVVMSEFLTVDYRDYNEVVCNSRDLFPKHHHDLMAFLKAKMS